MDAAGLVQPTHGPMSTVNDWETWQRKDRHIYCYCAQSLSVGMSGFFKNAGTPSSELAEARDAYQQGCIERQLEKTDLLIMDELSYMSFNKYESELLFKVISDRGERSSIIVTTNLSFSMWTELFENTTMVPVLADWLTY